MSIRGTIRKVARKEEFKLAALIAELLHVCFLLVDTQLLRQ